MLNEILYVDFEPQLPIIPTTSYIYMMNPKITEDSLFYNVCTLQEFIKRGIVCVNI